MVDPLREVARQDPEGTGILALGTGVAWDWETLDRAVDATVLRLEAYGLGAGDLVGIRLAPCVTAFLLLHAVPRLGGVLVPLHPAATAWELAAQVRGVGRLDLLLVPDGARDEVEGWILDHALPVHGVEGIAWLDPDGPVPVPDHGYRIDMLVDPDTPAVILLTSGSTGVPRPIPLSHGNLMASARGVQARLRLDPADQVLATLALAHVGGFAQLHRNTVVGCTTVFDGGTGAPRAGDEPEPVPEGVPLRFDPHRILQLAREGAWTHASLVPVMLQRLLDVSAGSSAPRGVRGVLLGGAATPPPLLARALAARWPVALTYGMTETTSQVATAPPEQVRTKPGTVGRPLDGVQVRIVDPATGDGVARGVTGELQVAGPTISASLIAPGRVAQDGWYPTGDLGHVDSEGDLWITGRRSQRIITGGTNVDPAEVEAVLLGVAGVREAVVGGLPDPVWGERVAAWIVLADPEAAPEEAARRLADECQRVLAPPRWPRTFFFVDEIPRNANGKVDAQALRRLRSRAVLPPPGSRRDADGSSGGGPPGASPPR
jgi:o-succinylbenzoate---CoA ligase